MIVETPIRFPSGGAMSCGLLVRDASGSAARQIGVIATGSRRTVKEHTASLHRRQLLRKLLLLAAALLSLTFAVANDASARTGTKVQPSKSVAEASVVPAGFSSRFARVRGIRLHYVLGGAGTPILLVHGWPEDWSEWRKVMPPLARDHTVIAVDLRGFGQSDMTAGGYDRRSLAEDLHALVTRLGFSNLVVVGHDWGAPVAYAYAALYPDAVERLVLAEGVPDGPWTLEQTAPFLHNPFWFFGFFEQPGYAETVLAGHEARFLDWFYRNPGFHVVPGAFSEADIARYEASFARPGRFGASLQLFRTIDRDIADNTIFSLTPLKMPVLAIGAERGIGRGVPAAVRHVAADVRPVLMLQTGHFLAEERPSDFAKLVEDFLQGRNVSETWTPESARQ